MHRPYYHNGYDAHGNGVAETCRECSHDNILVPVSFCLEAMRYLVADRKLDDLVDAWHLGDGPGLELHEYLGWTLQEFVYWVECFELPEHFINEQS